MKHASKWIDTGHGTELRPSDAKSSCMSAFKVQDRHGRDIWVPCGKCQKCIKFKITVMQGNLMAEAATAASVWFLSLTYAPEHYSEVFRYRDVSNMLKRLRYYYPGVRFFCVGEKGDLTQRNHWHVLLFFPEPVEVPKLRRGIPARHGKPAVPGELWKFWPYGFTSIKVVKTWSADDFAKQIRYVTLYMFKNEKKDGEYETVKAHWSCKPVLGYRFLFEQAMRYARINEGQLRLPLYVSFQGVKVSRNGPLWKFPIIGARRGHYIRSYYLCCDALYGDNSNGGMEVLEKITTKDLLGAAQDKVLRDEAEWRDFMRRHNLRYADRNKASEPKLTLSQKWKAYDEKQAMAERQASFSEYSKDRGIYDDFGAFIDPATGEVLRSGYASGYRD